MTKKIGLLCLISMTLLPSCQPIEDDTIQMEDGYHLVIFQDLEQYCDYGVSLVETVEDIQQGVAYIDIQVGDIASYNWTQQELILTEDASMQLIGSANNQLDLMKQYDFHDFIAFLEGSPLYCGKVLILTGAAVLEFPVIYFDTTSDGRVKLTIRPYHQNWQMIDFNLSDAGIINNSVLNQYLSNEGLVN